MDSEHINAPQDTAKQVEWAARLFDDYQFFIRATLRHFLKNPLEREDMFQDLFVYFVRKPVPDDVQNVKSWLYRVILDRVRDRRRRQERYRKRLENLPGRYEPLRDAPETRPNPDEIAAVFELIRTRLPENQAKAVLYKYQHQLEIDEISCQMKISTRTVSRYLSVGLKTLRSILDKNEKE